MRKFVIIYCLGYFLQPLLQGQPVNEAPFTEDTIILQTSTGYLEGTLLIPAGTEKPLLVLIIAGSGPTDRDGNNFSMKNNSLKFLAEELASRGVASFRYDKRGIGGSASALIPEKDLRFEHFVKDAVQWLGLLKKDKRFSGIYVLGHSEGSLIGMMASRKTKPAGFISLAGAGQKADLLIREQLKSQPPFIAEMANPILDSLSAGFTVRKINPMLNSLFRPDVQPYLISWFRYDPAEIISKLSMPVLIIQGSSDLQVSLEDSRILSGAAPGSKLVVIDHMNHVLKESETDRLTNLLTYNNPQLPVKKELPVVIENFIKSYCK